MCQQGLQSIISLSTTRENFRPDPGANRRELRELSSVQFSSVQLNSKKEFNRRVRSISTLKGQFKGRSSSGSEKAVRVEVQESSQPSRLVGPRRGAGPVGPRGIQGESVIRRSC
jgi:hypothetical protein